MTVALNFVAQAVNFTSALTYTFNNGGSGWSIGSADATKRVHLGIMYAREGNTGNQELDLSGCSVVTDVGTFPISITEVQLDWDGTASGYGGAYLVYAEVGLATSISSIVIDWDGGGNGGTNGNTTLAIWYSTGLVSSVAHSTATTLASPSALALSSTLPGGFAIAIGFNSDNAGFTWTNASERWDAIMEDNSSCRGSGADTTTVGGALTITGTHAFATFPERGAVAACWGPPVLGSLDATDGADDSSINGDVIVSGTFTGTDGADSSSLDGIVENESYPLTGIDGADSSTINGDTETLDPPFYRSVGTALALASSAPGTGGNVLGSTAAADDICFLVLGAHVGTAELANFTVPSEYTYLDGGVVSPGSGAWAWGAWIKRATALDAGLQTTPVTLDVASTGFYGRVIQWRNAPSSGRYYEGVVSSSGSDTPLTGPVITVTDARPAHSVALTLWILGDNLLSPSEGGNWIETTENLSSTGDDGGFTTDRHALTEHGPLAACLRTPSIDIKYGAVGIVISSREIFKREITLEALEGADSGSLEGDVLVSGSFAATEARDTVAISGTASLPQTVQLEVTEGSDSSTITGDVLLVGSFDITEGADGLETEGDVPVVGQFELSEGVDEAELDGFVIVYGEIFFGLEGPDAIEISGDVIVSGTLAATDGADDVTSETDVIVTASLSVTDAADLASLLGDVFVSGTLAATEGADSPDTSGDVIVTGSISAIDAADVSALQGDVIISGSMTGTDSPDIVSLSGDVIVSGSLSGVDGADTAPILGDIFVTGSLSVTDPSDTISFSGVITWPDIPGTLGATEAADSASIAGNLAVYGSLVGVTEGVDSISLIIAIDRTAGLEVADELNINGNVRYTGDPAPKTGAINNTPGERNFLSQLNFEFLIKKAPHLNFTVQKVAFPGIRLNSPMPNNPFVKTPYPGDHIEFGTLYVSFRLEKNMDNYLEMWNWITAMGFPQNHDQYAEIQNHSHWSGDGIYSDISLIINTGQHNENIDVTFHDAFPTQITPLILSSMDPDVDFIEATVKFAYTRLEVVR